MVYEYIREINFSRYRYRFLTYFNSFKNFLRLIIVINPIILCIIEKTTMYSCDHGYRNSLPGLVVRDIQWVRVREWLLVGWISISCSNCCIARGVDDSAVRKTACFWCFIHVAVEMLWKRYSRLYCHTFVLLTSSILCIKHE